MTKRQAHITDLIEAGYIMNQAYDKFTGLEEFSLHHPSYDYDPHEVSTGEFEWIKENFPYTSHKTDEVDAIYVDFLFSRSNG